MLNKVMIIGRLGRDPELRYTPGGQPLANLNIATDESYIDRDGNKVDRTEWHRVTVWGKAAENCNNYLAKGSLVYVEGSLQTRKWQDQQGQDRYSTDIKAQKVQFLDRKGDRAQGGDWNESPFPGGQASGQQGRASRPQNQGAPRQRQQPPDDDMGPAFPSEASQLDDVPF